MPRGLRGPVEGSCSNFRASRSCPVSPPAWDAAWPPSLSCDLTLPHDNSVYAASVWLLRRKL